jgi:hypothetical protein
MANKKERTQKKKTREGKKITKKEEPLKEEQPQEAPVAVEPQTPQTPFESLIYPFKVIISPMKAFQRISAYPDIKGFIVIIALLILASAAVQVSVASKLFLNINNQPTSLLSTTYLTDILLNGVIESIILFVFDWIIFASALLLIATLLGPKGSGWRPFFIIIGYAFTVLIVRTAATAALYSTLPSINVNFSVWPPQTDAEKADYLNQANAIWGPLLVAQIILFLDLAIDAWLAILGAIGVHVYRAVTWSRAAIISVTAYLIYLTLRIFLGLGF